MDLLPFGQQVKIIHKYLEYEQGWITDARPSYYNGHDWQYLIRTDKRLRSGYFLYGGAWFDEMYLKMIMSNEPVPKYLNIATPTVWPPKPAPMKATRPGLWVANGIPSMPDKMLGWRPAALTCFHDYLQVNRVFDYKAAHPETIVIIRFQHPQNWRDNPVHYADELGRQVASKWQEIKILDPYVYFANEMNLHYENGDQNPANQHRYTTPEFYQQYADWVRMTARIIKNIVPEMKLITPPFAFGHNEDGEAEDGIPKIGWAGYDFLKDTIHEYFDDILTFHGYWGDAWGEIPDRLYDPDLSGWYAYRWRRVLELFEVRYGIRAKMIIDECGNFEAGSPTFTQQLLDYCQNCLSDSRVLAVTPFLWDDPTNSPGNVLNSWVQQMTPAQLDEHCRRLAEFRLEGEQPQPEPEPEPEPCDFSAAVGKLDEAIAGLGEVNVELSKI